LGTLTASIAHELNNPVSAISRSAGALGSSLTAVEATSREIGNLGLTPSQWSAIEDVRKLSVARPNHNVRSPLEQEDRERVIANWLKQHKANIAIAEPLAETDLTPEILDQLSKSLSGPTLDKALCWIATDSSARKLLSEIQTASVRVSELVKSMKEYTQLDRVSVPEPLDIRQGIENTVRVLASKARMKSVGVTLNLAPNLPKVNGLAGEINQVWSNLIDNAIDAVPEGGRVDVSAKDDGRWVLVSVADNGSGIDSSIRDRIFDPFFTTKDVGKGTGLGLDIVRRLIQRHNGWIDLESNPGRTEFKVRLPASESDPRAKS
jgi:signal transduction histidine kinase